LPLGVGEKPEQRGPRDPLGVGTRADTGHAERGTHRRQRRSEPQRHERRLDVSDRREHGLGVVERRRQRRGQRRHIAAAVRGIALRQFDEAGQHARSRGDRLRRLHGVRRAVGERQQRPQVVADAKGTAGRCDGLLVERP
jgi:hypothetical protein